MLIRPWRDADTAALGGLLDPEPDPLWVASLPAADANPLELVEVT